MLTVSLYVAVITVSSVFCHLIISAIGTCTLSTESQAHKVFFRVTVVDNGVGMSPDQQNLLFKPFSQVGDTAYDFPVARRWESQSQRAVSVRSSARVGCSRVEELDWACRYPKSLWSSTAELSERVAS